jgi:hypothetical protein
LSTDYFPTVQGGGTRMMFAEIDKRMETWYKPRNSSMDGWLLA